MNNNSVLLLIAVFIVAVYLITPNEKFISEEDKQGNLLGCAPNNGQWSIAGAGLQGRSKLNSSCCNPPYYRLPSNYKTCSSNLDLTKQEDSCISNCCKYAHNQSKNYHPSWYDMAKCGCSLWCRNSDVPHFRKYGTAVNYIKGDLAEAKTGDTGNFIGSGGDFSGGTKSVK